MSPSTLALMCDEGDTMFTSNNSSDGLVVHNSSSQLPSEQGETETYAEQERIVLTKFRECLNRLITLGEIKGKFIIYFALYKQLVQVFRDIVTLSNFITKPRCMRTYRLNSQAQTQKKQSDNIASSL